MRKLAYALLVLCAGCLSEPKPAAAGGGDGGADDDGGGGGDGGDVDAAGPPRVVQIATGFGHTCALISDGRLRCWGENDEGELGHGNTATVPRLGDNELPSSAGDVPVGGAVRQVVAGNSFTCALMEEGGSVRCWGRASAGQSGNGTTTVYGDNEPASEAPFVELGAPAFQITAGANHACALLDAPGGDIICWGEGANSAATSGAIGYGMNANISGTAVGDDELPSGIRVGGVPVTNLDIVYIAAGSVHTCAVLASGGGVFCWGDDNQHQLGHPGGVNRIGDDEPASSAPAVQVGAAVRRIAGGQTHTCALLETGRSLTCWGFGADGSLGYGNPNTIGDGAGEFPSTAGTVQLNAEVLQVVTNGGYTCAILDKDIDEVRCWGTPGAVGRLGLGNTTVIGDTELPTSVAPLELGGVPESLGISNGLSSHSCAVLTGGDVRCWGNNNVGQLGLGNTDPVGDNELPSSQPAVEVL